MTTSLCPSVFDAGLPTLHYEFEEPPAQVYPRIREALQQAPMAIGPYGPEILSHELVRTVLRDPQFKIPPGMNLMAHADEPLFWKIAYFMLGTVATTALTAWVVARSRRLSDFLEALSDEKMSARDKLGALVAVWRKRAGGD